MTKEWIKDSIAFKLIVIGVLVLILLIPANMIRNLVVEREYTREEVVSDISSKWANNQTITGPIITIPYEYVYKDKDERKKGVSYAHFLPSQLNVKGEILPEERYRGIYKVIVYDSELVISGTFDKIDFSQWKIQPQDILWDEAFLSIGIPDMRGISNELKINFNNTEYAVDPGIRSRDVLTKGVSSNIVVEGGLEKHVFSFNLNLRGSELIYFTPVGKTTRVHLNSNWETPSFSGNFLPQQREVNEEGFSADWTVLHLNRDYPQKWIGNNYDVSGSAFGVDLLMPVDIYLKSERALKYALMFIALTFLVFFFTEIMSKKRFHPIQYLLIGVSLLVFYTLLLSFSEHIGFGKAYLLASSAIVGLIGFYTHTTLKDIKMTGVVISVLMSLYVFLYTILQLEAYSLLMGSVGVFIVLTLIMFLSRKINWYAPIRDRKS